MFYSNQIDEIHTEEILLLEIDQNRHPELFDYSLLEVFHHLINQ